MIEPEIGTKLLRLGGFYKNRVDIVEYQGMFRKTGYCVSRMLTEAGGQEVSHTPKTGHLFTQDGIDIHTGEKTNDVVILSFLSKNENKND